MNDPVSCCPFLVLLGFRVVTWKSDAAFVQSLQIPSMICFFFQVFVNAKEYSQFCGRNRYFFFCLNICNFYLCAMHLVFQHTKTWNSASPNARYGRGIMNVIRGHRLQWKNTKGRTRTIQNPLLKAVDFRLRTSKLWTMAWRHFKSLINPVAPRWGSLAYSLKVAFDLPFYTIYTIFSVWHQK